MAKGLFVGLTTMDFLYYLEGAYPGENEKVKTGDFMRCVGGPAANAAITYALLGGDAVLATCLGNSQESRAVLQELGEFGVTVLNYSMEDVLPNMAAVAVSPNGNRAVFSGQRVFKKTEEPALGQYDFALFDCNQQEVSLELLNTVKETMQDTKIVLDAGSWKDNIELFLQKADIVIASEKFKNPKGEDIFQMAECRAGEKAMTCGENPVRYNGKFIDVPKVKAVDTLGAGDIFHGAFCFAAFHEGKAVEEALAYGARAASFSTTCKGRRDWISRFFNGANGLTFHDILPESSGF